MNSIDKIIKRSWTKNWSGNWGLLFGSLYGTIYTKGLKDLTGKYFHHNLITFEKNTSSNYLIQEELHEYCNYLVTLILKDKKLTQKWSNQVIKNTDKIFVLMKNYEKKKFFTLADFKNFQSLRLEITTANFSIKKVIDYLPAELIEKNLESFSQVRVYTEPVYNMTDALKKRMVHTITNNKLTNQDISVLTTDELDQFFSSNTLPKKETLKERFMGCAIYFDKNGKYQLFSGEHYRNLITRITDNSKRAELKGMAAYPGIVRGKVKIVMDPKKCKDFPLGTILVAGMTRPEYLSLMKKSAASITDAGGLLSHAAIVARELKKPCVVGTEIATKVLKDGDLVEVDATRGIIKKIINY